MTGTHKGHNKWFYGEVLESNQKTFFLGINQLRRAGLRIVCCFVSGTPKGSPKVLMVLWSSRELNLCSLVYKTGLSPTLFVAFLGIYQYAGLV